MRLYHYAPLRNTCLTEGILSISKNPSNLKSYVTRVGSEDKEDILCFLEKTFEGRCRSISCLTEPIVWQNNDAVLKKIVEHSELFSFELDELLKDNLIEAIWCKKGCWANGINEQFVKITKDDIDTSPRPWEICDSSKGLLFGVICHYLIVLKDGFIPPQYLTLEEREIW